MRIIEPDKPATECCETQITIDLPEHCVELVEIHRSADTGLVFVQVTVVRVIESSADHKRSPDLDFRRLQS